MLRVRRVTTVCQAMTATLLSLAVLAHAAAPQAEPGNPWTQVDLASVPDAVFAASQMVQPSTAVVPPIAKPVSLVTPATLPMAVLAPAPLTPAVAAKPVPTFALSAKDRTVRGGLERWATAAGWKLSWELPEGAHGGLVRFDADFGVDFEMALSRLAAALRSETRVHAYLYGNNKVLRIVEESARPAVATSAVPMTPTIQDGMQRDLNDRGLAHVTRIKGYWLGASGTETKASPAEGLPPVFKASVSLVFSTKATIATVIGILSKITSIPIILPGALEYPAISLFVNDSMPDSKDKERSSKAKKTYYGTPKELLDRISISTGLLWEFSGEAIIFTE
jgi:hypothetical protein